MDYRSIVEISLRKRKNFKKKLIFLSHNVFFHTHLESGNTSKHREDFQEGFGKDLRHLPKISWNNVLPLVVMGLYTLEYHPFWPVSLN